MGLSELFLYQITVIFHDDHEYATCKTIIHEKGKRVGLGTSTIFFHRYFWCVSVQCTGIPCHVTLVLNFLYESHQKKKKKKKKRKIAL